MKLFSFKKSNKVEIYFFDQFLGLQHLNQIHFINRSKQFEEKEILIEFFHARPNCFR